MQSNLTLKGKLTQTNVTDLHKDESLDVMNAATKIEKEVVITIRGNIPFSLEDPLHQSRDLLVWL